MSEAVAALLSWETTYTQLGAGF